MLLKYEVVRVNRESPHSHLWTSKVVARFPRRGLAERYAAFRDHIDPRPYHFYEVKER